MRLGVCALILGCVACAAGTPPKQYGVVVDLDAPDATAQTADVPAADLAATDAGAAQDDGPPGTDAATPDAAAEVASWSAPANPGPCDDFPPPAAPPLAPMQYAGLSPWTQGKVACGDKPAPYFWASATLPAPVACTTSCADAPHADKMVCAGGQCLVARCADGWEDLDAWGGNGCELPVASTCTLLVDAAYGGKPGGDGSAAHPFGGLRSALCAAKPGCILKMAPGDYAGPVVLDKPGLVLRGAGPDLTRVLAAHAMPATPGTPAVEEPGCVTADSAIAVAADDVVVEGLATARGHVGIQLGLATASAAPLIHRPRIRNVAVDGTGTCTSGVTTIGIDSKQAADARVVASSVRNIASVSTGAYQPPSLGYGISLSGTGARVFGVRVADVFAGSSCFSSWKGPFDCAPMKGGNAYGIATGSDVVVSGSEVTGLHAGIGGSYDNWGTTTLLSNLAGNLPAGAAIAFSTPLSDPTDQVDGWPWLSLSGCQGGEVSGYTAAKGPARILVEKSVGITVKNNTISGTQGREAAISLSDCSNCTVVDNVVKGIRAPGIVIAGGSAVTVAGNQISDVAKSCDYLCSDGSPVTGLAVKSCAGCTLSANSVSHVVAGTGSLSKDTLIASGVTAIGIQLASCADANLIDNIVAGVKGGDSRAAQGPPPGADGVGIQVDAESSVTVHGGVIRDIKPGFAVTMKPTNDPWPDLGGNAIGLHCLGACPGIDHLAIAQLSMPAAVTCPPPTYFPPSCADFQPGTSYGISFGPATAAATIDHLSCAGAEVCIQAPKTLVNLTNSLIQGASTCAVDAPAGSIAWTDVWQSVGCATKLVVGAGMTSFDPGFTSATDLHLLPTSAAIDAADPTAPYCLEPKPNGCRADLGAYGNTSAATPKAGAKQCACP